MSVVLVELYEVHGAAMISIRAYELMQPPSWFAVLRVGPILQITSIYAVNNS